MLANFWTALTGVLGQPLPLFVLGVVIAMAIMVARHEARNRR